MKEVKPLNPEYISMHIRGMLYITMEPVNLDPGNTDTCVKRHRCLYFQIARNIIRYNTIPSTTLTIGNEYGIEDGFPAV